MSLLRQRAIEVSVESTFSARSPAEARDWFVRLTSFFSDDEPYEPASQASAVRGTARTPTDVTAKANASPIARRPRAPTKRRAGAVGSAVGATAGTTDIRRF